MPTLGNPDEPFEFNAPIFLVAPLPRPAGQSAAVNQAAQLEWTDEQGVPAVAKLAFTDVDLAAAFIARQPAEAAARLSPIALPDLGAVEEAVRYMRQGGVTDLMFDPEMPHVGRCFTVGHVLSVLRRR